MSGFQNIGRIPELKRRILMTLALLAVYRIGVHIPTPGVDGTVLASIFERARGTLLGFFDMFAGGGLEKLSVFALGIMPYISASIILQLLDGRRAYPREVVKGRGGGQAENHPVHPVRDGRNKPHPRVRHRRWA